MYKSVGLYGGLHGILAFERLSIGVGRDIFGVELYGVYTRQ
jgi:hypothetical protein